MKNINQISVNNLHNGINQSEYLEIKSLLLEHNVMLSMIMPSKSTVSFISDVTGVSRQTITSFLKRHFEPEVDYWLQKGKIYLSKTTTMQLLRKYNGK